MRFRTLSLLSLTVWAPGALLAQRVLDPSGVTRRTISAGFLTSGAIRLIASQTAAVACDNTALKEVEAKKSRGNTIRLLGGGAAVLGGLMVTSSQSSSTVGTGSTLLLGGLVTLIVGGHMQASADQPAAMDAAVQTLSVGSTTTSEVQTCLGKPSTTTSKSSGEEQWSYQVIKRSTNAGLLGYFMPFGQGTADIRSVTLTFKKGVLSDVSKTATAF